MGEMARNAAERVLRLTALIWCGMWMVSLAWTLLAEPTITTLPPLTWACLVALFVSWVGMLASAAWIAAFVTVAATTSLAQLVSVNVSGSEDYFTLAATWASLATVAAALLLPRRQALPAIVGISAMTVVILMLVAEGSGQWPAVWRQVADAGIYALVDGVAVSVASRELRAAARVADVESARLARLRRDESARVASHEAIQGVHRVIHDTFVNTLGAIRAGAGLRSPQDVRSRCRFDLSYVLAARAGSSARSVDEVADGARVVASGLGLQVGIDASTVPGAGVSDDVWRAVMGVVREALVNVSKHSGCARAQVGIHLDEDSLSLVVEDAGCGWSGFVPAGGGIAESIVARAAVTGGRTVVATSPQAGTRIEARWPSASHDGEHDVMPSPTTTGRVGVAVAHSRMPSALRRTYAEAGIWLVVLVVSQSLIYAQDTQAVNALMALVIVVGSMIAMLAGPWSVPPLPAWATLALAGLMVPVALLPSWGAVGCPAVGPGSWGLDGALVLALAICLLGSSLLPIFAATAALAFAVALPFVLDGTLVESCGSDSLVILLIECGAMVAVFLFRRLLIRLLSEADRDSTLAAELRARRAADMARDSSRDARYGAVLSGVEPFLQALADGRLNPADPRVRTEAAMKETALRSLLTLGPDLGMLGHVLARCLVNAAHADRSIDIRCAEPVPDPAPEIVEGIMYVLDVVVGATSVGGVVSVGLVATDTGGSMTIVIPATRDVLERRDRDALAGAGLTVQSVVLKGEVLVEVSW